MENNTDNLEVATGNIFKNFLDNWLNIVIVIAVLLVVILLVRIVALRMRRLVDKKISDEKMVIKKRTYTFTSVVSNLIIVVASVAAILIIADQIGISVTPLLAGAGVAGIVIGFGAQSLIKDLINGTFILLEQWYQINDIVTIGDASGVVERFNLRTTVLRDLEGTLHFIPNGEINRLSNRTHTWSRALIEVGVHYKENIDRVVGVLEEVFDELVNDKKYKDSILERPEILGDGGVNELGDSAVKFTIICKVKPAQQWTISRQLRKRIKDKFDQVGIEIPYPCTNVYMRDKS
ncbi:MAG: mechanosensitive ion channel family protein [Actinobacteria bacterium]|nr:mechanosensitive ion channel family protein [Actinomycetota bacterium]MBL7123964.1 mechanosensitive ion channel family protein [Actinomycetota bacterium]